VEGLDVIDDTGWLEVMGIGEALPRDVQAAKVGVRRNEAWEIRLSEMHPHPEALYYHVAQSAVKAAKNEGDEFRRKQAVVTAMVFSALCLEAFINQEYASHTEIVLPPRELDRFPLRGKWSRLPGLLGSTGTFDEAVEPFRTFQDLVRTRNQRLVHFKPTEDLRRDPYFGDLVNDVSRAEAYVTCMGDMIRELNRLTSGKTSLPPFLTGSEYLSRISRAWTIPIEWQTAPDSPARLKHPRSTEGDPEAHPMAEMCNSQGNRAVTHEYIVLVCGLNIRGKNRIVLDEQRRVLEDVAGELEIRPEGDKGSYAVLTQLEDPHRVVKLILDAFATHHSDLKISGAAVALVSDVKSALAKLTQLLTERFGPRFNVEDYSITPGEGRWRAGLALPLSPAELPDPRLQFHETKNAMVFGWTKGGILIAKRGARNVHWGTAVTDPARRLIRDAGKGDMNLTSRSGNILQALVGEP
jgi:hypothetical protein